MLGATADIFGKIIIAYTAIRVHHRFKEEHKIDEAVFHAMAREQRMSFIGVGLMICGYLLQLPAKIHV